MGQDGNATAGGSTSNGQDDLSLDRLDNGQRAICEASDPLLAVEAPPGTGKTTCLAALFAHLVNTGTPPQRVLVCTFTVRAARHYAGRLRRARACDGWSAAIVDPRERVYQESADPPPLWIGTTHDVCARILRCHVETTGRTGRMRTVGPEEARWRMREAMRRAGLLSEGEDGADERLVQTCWEALEKGKRSTKWRPGAIASGSEWEEAHRIYEADLLADDCIDLPDHIALVFDLFRREEAIRNAWARRFDVVMVDEFQDTDPIVIEMLRVLAFHARVIVAGDSSQSIYGWRDAVGTFQCLRRLETTHGLPRRMTLMDDYRLPRAIQMAAAALRGKMREPTPSPTPTRKGGSLSDPSWESVPGGADPVEVLAQRINETLRSPHDASPKMAVGFQKDDARKSCQGDVIVVARRHERCIEIAKGLTARKWKVRVGSRGARDDATTAWIAWMAAIANPHADARVMRAIAKWPFEITGRTRAELRTRADLERTSVGEVLAGGARIRDRTPAVEEAGVLLREGSQRRDNESAAEVLEWLDEQLKLGVQAAQGGERALRSWTQAKEIAYELAKRGGDLEAIAQAIEDESAQEDCEPEPDRVSIRTMHAVKGQEFRHVFAMYWEEGEFPVWWHDADIEEERRIALTTLTRATRTFTAIVRSESESGGSLAPSRFLDEAGIKCRTRAA